METNQQKVDRLQAELDALLGQSPRNESAVAQTASALDEAKRELEQEQAAMVRIQGATEQAAYFLDNLVIEGLTMRELCVDEPQYQMLRIAVQNQIISMAEDFSKQVSDVQAEDNIQIAQLKQQLNEAQAKIEENSQEAYEDSETIKQLREDLHQAKLEVADYQKKLKNATDEIDRLNSQVDDLRKEIAVGARNAYKVTDVDQAQQLKQLAEQIKASRIPVYDVKALDYNRSNFSAINANTGEPFTYNWTAAKNYVEITDPNEVEQFRQKFANKDAVQDSTLAESVQNGVTQEATFPEVPRAEAPGLPTEPVQVDPGQSSGEVPAAQDGVVTRAEFEALKLRVVELEKVCNINEDTDNQAVA